MDVIFPGSTYADQDEEVSVIWQSYAGEEPHSAVHLKYEEDIALVKKQFSV